MLTLFQPRRVAASDMWLHYFRISTVTTIDRLHCIIYIVILNCRWSIGDRTEPVYRDHLPLHTNGQHVTLYGVSLFALCKANELQITDVKGARGEHCQPFCLVCNEYRVHHLFTLYSR